MRVSILTYLTLYGEPHGQKKQVTSKIFKFKFETDHLSFNTLKD